MTVPHATGQKLYVTFEKLKIASFAMAWTQPDLNPIKNQ